MPVADQAVLSSKQTSEKNQLLPPTVQLGMVWPTGDSLLLLLWKPIVPQLWVMLVGLLVAAEEIPTIPLFLTHEESSMYMRAPLTIHSSVDGRLYVELKFTFQTKQDYSQFQGYPSIHTRLNLLLQLPPSCLGKEKQFLPLF